MLTFEEINKRLEQAKREDGTYEIQAIADMNAMGIHFTFTQYGVGWKYANDAKL